MNEKTQSQKGSKTWIKFLLLAALLLAYFAYLSWKYDIVTGGIASLLTWTFFVLCTPIADAGALLDFPLRMIFGVRMIYSELIVWCIAISLNLFSFYWHSDFYHHTILTRLLYHILSTPYPYWLVIGLSALGTFLSIYFGDNIMDAIHQKDKHFFHSKKFKHLLMLAGIFLVIAGIYYELIISLGIDNKL